MTIAQTRASLKVVETRLRELADIADNATTPEDITEFDGLLERQASLNEEVAAHDAFLVRRSTARDALAERLAAGDVHVEASADPLDAATVNLNTRAAESPWERQGIADGGPEDYMARAMSAVEKIGTDDGRKEALTQILERGQGQIAEMVLATTSPAYRSAFAEYLRTGQMDQRDPAVQYAEPLRRAMAAGTDNAGGYLVPTDIEQAVTLSADGTSAPVYSLGRRVQTTGTTYRNVSSPNATWSWDGENTEVSDDTPTFANTDITLYYAQGLVPMSIASMQSIEGALSIATDVLKGGYMDLVGAATSTGTGSSQPFGIVTAATAGTLTSATTDVFAVADVYSTHEALPQRHRRNATWLANINIINDMRQFATDAGHALLARLADGTPGSLLGSRLVENPDMDGVINATAHNYVLVYGDFSHYVIAEGIGTLAEVIPHIMGTNGRPIGARGLYMATRFGADSVLDAAFEMMNIT